MSAPSFSHCSSRGSSSLRLSPSVLPPAESGLGGHLGKPGLVAQVPGGGVSVALWKGRQERAGAGCSAHCSHIWPARGCRSAVTWPFLPGLLGFALPPLTGTTVSRADSSHHPSPCQIVLNYNDKRWQASTATSQNMTNTPVRGANKLRSPHHSVPDGRLAGLSQATARPTWLPRLDAVGPVRVGASGRAWGPVATRDRDLSSTHPLGPSVTCSFQHENNNPPARRAAQCSATFSLEQHLEAGPQPHHHECQHPRGVSETPGRPPNREAQRGEAGPGPGHGKPGAPPQTPGSPPHSTVLGVFLGPRGRKPLVQHYRAEEGGDLYPS